MSFKEIRVTINGKQSPQINVSLGKRVPKSIFDECGIDPQSKIPIEEQKPGPLPDRAELDKIVFDARFDV